MPVSRHGPPKRYPNRRNITLRCDAKVWERTQAVTAMLPGVSVSDVVEEFLDGYATNMEQLGVAVEAMGDTPEERLAALHEWAAAIVGQGVLKLSREVFAFEAEEGERST